VTQLTAEQIDELRQEIVHDPLHDCSVFGPWFEQQMKEHGTNDLKMVELLTALERRRAHALVNLALRRYGTHD
jgi:hypothetical protein